MYKAVGNKNIEKLMGLKFIQTNFKPKGIFQHNM